MTINKPKFLMCRPEHFSIAYEINPWMNIKNPADPFKAQMQWDALYHVLETLGSEISLIDSEEGLPDMVFTANAALVWNNKAIMSHLRFKERQGEEKYHEKWISSHGYDYCRLPEGIFFEGEGDAVFYKDMILLGHGFRTDINSHSLIAELTGRRYQSLRLTDPRFYHLDTCLMFIRTLDLILYYPSAFDAESIRVIEGLPSEKIRVSDEDAGSFVCNSICIGMNILLYKCSETLHASLRDRGLNAVFLDTSEFMKSGGSVRCMVLHLG